MTTFTLRNGVRVLAHFVGGDQPPGTTSPKHYVNRTQAERKAAELRVTGHPDAFVYKSPASRPFYVAFANLPDDRVDPPEVK